MEVPTTLRSSIESLRLQSLPWWKRGVVYQIYPRSFADASGDGIGDLGGITQHVEYLEWLGIDAVWLSPVYESPMVDYGYDVSDYVAIDPIFGTFNAFDGLLDALHRSGIKLIMDFVPNHSSDRHLWFRESRSSRESAKRDWYVWSDGRDGGAPNNWESYFGGSAWTLDPQTSQYYLHSYDRSQPDLNWENPEVREALKDAMRFWLRRGVDGFRVDVLWQLGKDPQLRDNPENPGWDPSQPFWRRQIRRYSEDWPSTHEYARELRRVIDEFDDRVMIGEVVLPPERMVAYYGAQLDEAHLPFNFSLMEVKEWAPRTLAATVEAYEAQLPPGAWPNWFVGNHDFERIASRIGPERVRLIFMLLLTLRGTPTLYYGDELGLPDGVIPPDIAADPQSRGTPSRDREAARTPMPWTNEAPHAGFSVAQPWLPLATDDPAMNVSSQSADPASLLNLLRSLLTVRRTSAAAVAGEYRTVAAQDDVLVYERLLPDERLFIALNFGESERTVELPERAETILTTSVNAPRVAAATVTLRPFEGLIAQRC